MAHVLLLGAGRSSSYLIAFLTKWQKQTGLELTIADSNLEHLIPLFGHEIQKFTHKIDASDPTALRELIEDKTLVISLLPASMHDTLVPYCIDSGAHLLTASYVSAQMRSYDPRAKEKGVLLLNECGLDPGLDHLSAMELLDKIRQEGGQIWGFESYCGGLVAPASDNNPWGYKFSWNPRNVVLAGQGGLTKFRRNGRNQFLPYHRLFESAGSLEISGYGKFDAYPNRDSLSYTSVYGLDSAQDLIRGTLRKEGFCKAWQVFVAIGLTDNSTPIHNSEELTFRQWMEAFADQRKLQALSQDHWHKFEWLDLYSDEKIGLKQATSAQILEHLLAHKWELQPSDRDMVVMQHLVRYELAGNEHRIKSSLVVEGSNNVFTAMAKTVGLPLGLAAQLVLDGGVTRRGVAIPVYSEFYQPLLARLKEYGIFFQDEPF